MAQAHQLQIGFGQCCGSILGLGLGSLQPTTNPYGFLVVKQAEKKLKGMSWPCKSKRSNEGCGSHADEGNFGAEGEGTQEAQMLRGVWV